MNAVPVGGSTGKALTQGGMVLLSCLLFLTALTLLGLSASADTILQQKLAANFQETERAKQSALSTLRWAEAWLLGLEGPAPDICIEPCNGLRLHSTGELPLYPESESLSWWLQKGHEAGIDPLSGERLATIAAGAIDTPLWIIEVLHERPPGTDNATDLQVWYRILARGSGHSDTGISVIESTVVRSWAAGENTGLSGTEGTDSCPGSASSATCRRIAWRNLR